MTCPLHLPPCGKAAEPIAGSFPPTGRMSRQLFFTATATPPCIQTIAVKFLSRPSVQRARKKRCIVARYLEAMNTPARPIPTRADAKSWSIGISTAPPTRGQEVALRAPTRIRGDQMQRGKCCVFFSGIRFPSNQRRAGLRQLISRPSCEALRQAAPGGQPVLS